jgi:hypothetical protein
MSGACQIHLGRGVVVASGEDGRTREPKTDKTVTSQVNTLPTNGFRKIRCSDWPKITDSLPVEDST